MFIKAYLALSMVSYATVTIKATKTYLNWRKERIELSKCKNKFVSHSTKTPYLLVAKSKELVLRPHNQKALAVLTHTTSSPHTTSFKGKPNPS